jgi:hypothetical protein
MLFVALALVLFVVAAYLRPDAPGKLAYLGLAALTVALVMH